jgi:pleiotropic regulator 1
VGEYGDATILHPAIQSQQLNQAGPGRPAKGKGRDDGTAGSNTLESEWIEDIEKKRGSNGATAGPSVAPPPSANGGALIKHSDQKLPPPGEYDRSSSLSMALQLKRRQLDNVAKPEVYHPRWKLSRVIAGHLGWVRAIAVDPGNQWFATGAGDRMIKVSTEEKPQHRKSPCSCTLVVPYFVDLGFGLWRVKAFTHWTYLGGERSSSERPSPLPL